MISKLSKRVFLKLAMYLLSIKLTEMVCDRLNVEIEMMLDLDSREVKWRPPIKRTIASKGPRRR